MAGAAQKADENPKTDVATDAEAVEVKKQTEQLRKATKAQLKAAMLAMVVPEKANTKAELKKSNPHLTAAEWAALGDLKFPTDKPVIAGIACSDYRDRPRVHRKELGKGKFYAHVLAYYYKLSKTHGELKDKSGEWWKNNAPLEFEVSHLFDGVRPDINPENLCHEPHDVNKSRVFCRLLFETKEKEFRKTNDEPTAYQLAVAHVTPICTQLHQPPCKFLHPTVGRSINQTLIRRRTQWMNEKKGKGKGGGPKRKASKAQGGAAKKRKTVSNVFAVRIVLTDALHRKDEPKAAASASAAAHGSDDDEVGDDDAAEQPPGDDDE